MLTSVKLEYFIILNSYINSIYYYNQCSNWEYLFQPTPC